MAEKENFLAQMAVLERLTRETMLEVWDKMNPDMVCVSYTVMCEVDGLSADESEELAEEFADEENSDSLAFIAGCKVSIIVKPVGK